MVRDSFGNAGMITTMRKVSGGKADTFMSVHQLREMGMTEPDVTVPEGDAKKGAKVFKSKCAQCHTVAEKADARVGPNLFGVFGREAGKSDSYQQVAGDCPAAAGGAPNEGLRRGGRNPHFRGDPHSFDGRYYSEATKSSGILWTPKHMFKYLEKPQSYIPGTKMQFCGINKEGERADIIAYLAKFGGSLPVVTGNVDYSQGNTQGAVGVSEK